MFAIVICLVLFICTMTISIVCINGRRYVYCSQCDVVSNECNEPTSCLVQPIGSHCCEVVYFGCFGFRSELGFLNCVDVCMCVVNKQYELLELDFDFVYVDLQYDEISLTYFNCWVSVLVLCLWSCSRLWYVCEFVVVPYVDEAVAVTVIRVLLFLLHVCLLREWDGVRLTVMLVWG